MLNPAPAWKPSRSSHLTLWHGCTLDDAKKIAGGINLSSSRLALDFGRGFYTTTLRRQAKHWARLRFDDPRTVKAGNSPVALRFIVSRRDLADLKCLAFVRGHYDNVDFWSLVQHCRSSVDAEPALGIVARINDHLGPVHDGVYNWYDVVSGPVAAFWTQRAEMSDADQFSFHTTAAVAVLNKLIVGGGPGFKSFAV